ncbi:GGDEF domain-containing protein [Enterobacter hormaechei]|uniref:GGDEF domain-containing protein n=1 Tax=Leclercia sp. AS011 TaxID=3081257 RepID=UPI003019B694
MYLFSRKKIASKVYAISAAVCALFLTIMMAFIFLHQKNEAIRLTNEVRAKLLTIFDENENIADAITTKYTTSLQNGGCEIPALANDNGQWHWQKSALAAGDYGSLFLNTPPGLNERCLLSSAMFVRNYIAKSDLSTKEGFRYIISMRQKMFYFFSSIHSDSFAIEDSTMFNNLQFYIPSMPDYYKRKLTHKLTQKGTVATPIYHDLITRNSAYSVVSFIYDLNSSNVPVAYLLYDHNLEELHGLANTLARHNKWVKITLHETDSPNKLCIYGCDINDHFQTNVESPLSSQFKVITHINIIECIYHSMMFKLLLPFTLLLFVLVVKLTSRYLTRVARHTLIDHLTGLYSRKIESELKHATLESSFFALVDCNKFKIVNDRYGHAVGDKVLQRVADVIKHTIRREDIAIRYGGDEFLIILKTEHKSVAQRVMQRIAEEIARRPIGVNGEAITSTISYGISKFSRDLKTSILLADKEMYKMKKQQAPSPAK